MTVVYKAGAQFRAPPHVSPTVLAQASIVKNVHYNLTAWSSSTFVLAQRCSTGGNAYQCTTPGSSTAAPTGTGTGINNGGAAVFTWLSAIDYTTIQAWATALPTHIGAPQEAHIWTNYSGATTTAGTSYLTLSGHTTSAASYLLIRAAPGESYRDQGTGNALAINTTYALFQLPATTGGVNYFSISDNFVTFEGLQFLDPDSTSGSTIFDVPGAHFSFIGCIFDGTAQTGGASMSSYEGINVAFENCLIIDRQASGAGQIPTVFNSTATGKITNTTFIGINNPTSTSAVVCNNTTSGSVVTRNCAVFGYPSGFSGVGGNGVSADHCVFSASSIGIGVNDNGGNLLSKTAANQFVSATTDFRLKAGADCIGAGVADPTDIPTADDIYRQARGGGAWDVGAAKLSTVAYALALAASNAQVTVRRLQIGLIRGVDGADPFSSDFSSDFGGGGGGGGGSTQATTLIEAFIPGSANNPLSLSLTEVEATGLKRAVSVIRSAADAQAAHFARQASYFRSLLAIDAQSVHFARQVSYFRSLLATNAQVTGFAAHEAYFRSLLATSTESVSTVKQVGWLRSAVDAQTAARTLLVSMARGAVDAQHAVLAAFGLHPRSFNATNAQAASLQRLVSIIRSAVDAQAASLAKSSAYFRSLLATNAQAASLARLVAYIRSLLAASAEAASLTKLVGWIRSAVDAEVAHATATFQAGTANFPKILSATSAEAVALLRQTNKILAATSSQAGSLARLIGHLLVAVNAQASSRVLLVSIIRGAVDAQAATRFLGLSIVRSATNAQASARTLLVSITRRAVDAQSTAMAAPGLHPRAFSTTDAQAASLQRLTGIIRGAVDAQIAARRLLVSVIRSAVDAQAAARVLAVSIIRSAVDVQASSLQRGMTVIRSAVDAEVVHAVASAIRAKVLSAVDAEVAFCVATFNHAGVNTGKALNAVSIEVAALSRQAAKLVTTASTEVAAVARALSLSRAYSAASTQAASSLKTVGKLLSYIVGQFPDPFSSDFSSDFGGGPNALVTSLSTAAQHARALLASEGEATSSVVRRAQIRSLSAIQGQVARLASQVSHLRSLLLAGTQAVSLQRLTGIIRGAANAQVALRVLLVGKRIASVSGEATSSNAIRAFGHACSAVSGEAASMARAIGHALAAASGEATGMVRAIGLHLAYPASQVANLGRLAGHALVATQAALQSMLAQKLRSLPLFAQQAEACALFVQKSTGQVYHLIATALSTNSATVGRGFVRFFGAASTAATSFAALLHRALPLLLRRRVVRLPPPEDIVTLPPSVRRVLLPREEDEMSDYEIYQPEPAFFSPFDPADEETFTFDWTNRAYPGDAIVFASIVSVPSGLNLVGPAFIDGTLVEITVGPFACAPQSQPATYSLRCMAVFASGRISNYSIPFKVYAL